LSIPIRKFEDKKLETIQSGEQTEKKVTKGVCPEESLGRHHAYQCIHQRNLRKGKERKWGRKNT
jgi:hypothetical protein